ncbi:MAG: hypothetical protein ACJASF_002313 [Vicingaceae bacterium]|jgi:hypothetical protein
MKCIGIVRTAKPFGVIVPSGNSLESGPNKLINAKTDNVPINVINAFLSVITLLNIKKNIPEIIPGIKEAMVTEPMLITSGIEKEVADSWRYI